MDDGEAKIWEDMVLADDMLETVLDQLNGDHDELYRVLLKGMLRRQAKDRIVLAIWGGLTEEQNVRLRGFLEECRVADKWLGEEGALIEFAMLHDDLKEKVFDELTVFFKEFIETFNSVSED